MPLHLQHHKSYHPYNKDNIERVRRDEHEAKVKEEIQRRQAGEAEAEARIDLLRKKAKREERFGLGEGPESAEKQRRYNDDVQGQVHRGDQAAGHVNFWDKEEKSGVGPATRRNDGQRTGRSAVKHHHAGSSSNTGNDEYEAEQRAERQRFEDRVTMYLGKPAKELQPWYQSKDLTSGQERKKTHEQRLEDAYRDSLAKSSSDPLRTMNVLLAQRNALTDQDKSRGTGLENPSTSQAANERRDARSKAEAREATESARVAALLQSRDQAAPNNKFRIDETPAPRGYNDQFFREDVEAAHSSSTRRSLGEHERRKERTFEQDFQERPEIIDPGPHLIALPVNNIDKGAEANMIWQGTSTLQDTERESAETRNTVPMTTLQDTVGTKRPDAIPLQVADSEDRTGSPMQHSISTESTDSVESSKSTDSLASRDSNGRPRESMYPLLLGEMIETVLGMEHYLFSDAEQRLLRAFFGFNYEARHLLARLIQRRSTWHRVDKLNYDFDVKDKESAVASLCAPLPCEDMSDLEGVSLSRYCLNEQDMDGGDQEALNLMTLEELKILAKSMNKLKGVTTKGAIINALLLTKDQGTLSSFAQGAQSRQKAQSVILREQLAEMMGGCIRVNPAAQAMIDRVALVYYRAAEIGGSALTTAVLSRSRKRAYPLYAWRRSANIFASRQQLLDMQRALALELQMDQWIEWEGTPEAIRKALGAFEESYEEWKRAVAEGEAALKDMDRSGELKSYNRMRFHPGWPLTRVIYKGVYILGRLHRHEQEAEVLRRLLAQRVFRRGRRGDWYDRLALITAQYPASQEANVVRRAKREALSVSVQGIEDPDTHLIYHDTLQRRIARLESQLKLPFSEKHDFSYAKLRQCQDRVFKGARLDRMQGEVKGIFGINVPLVDDRRPAMRAKPRRSNGTTSSGDSSMEGDSFTYKKPLRKVVKVEKQRESGTSPEKASFEHSSYEDEGEVKSRGDRRELHIDSSFSVERRDVRKDMHSVWRGLDGEPCRVESLVLQHYEQDGYKGFHCEGSALMMLFALLMWDIIFMPLDGVFETPFQKQPLDLQEDSFAIVRGPEIRQRLMEIEATGGLHLIRETDKRERERKTWAVGCRWQEYTLQDLLELAECMGGHALSVVCQMLCEEFGHCTAGMPDLVVWRYSDKRVRFCEVKGPGDKLSDKQKLWIDVLLRAGLHVEVSKVEEG